MDQGSPLLVSLYLSAYRRIHPPCGRPPCYGLILLKYGDPIQIYGLAGALFWKSTAGLHRPAAKNPGMSSSPRSVPLLPFTSTEVLSRCRSFRSSETPILFIASYPKSGTTWLQCIVYYILRRQDPQCEAMLDHISHFSPFFEHESTWDELSSSIRQDLLQNHLALHHHVFNTHLLPWMLPLAEPRVRAIYITRRPKSVVTSFYHHLHNQVDHGGGLEDSFTTFLHRWLEGELPYGTWVEHVSDWLSAPGQTLFLAYEDLIADLPAGVRQVSRFLGVALTPEEEDLIVARSSFHAMRDSIDKFQPISVKWRPGFSFIRRGEVDDRSLFAEAGTEDLFDTKISEEYRKVDFEQLSRFVRL